MNERTAANINQLAEFCGKRDVRELSVEALQERYGIKQADVAVLFGGSILPGGDVFAEAIRNQVAKRYVIVGGAGHTTESLRERVRETYPDCVSPNMPEAEIFQNYMRQVYGVWADYLETKSTNCGNNITYLLELLRKHEISFQSIILCQDATMQHRMEATLRKYVGEAVQIINYATYHASVLWKDGSLAYAEPIEAMWDMERYVKLLVGEIPRLSDEEGGYGPRGTGYIAHVDIPKEVRSAYEELTKEFGMATREANPEFASVRE